MPRKSFIDTNILVYSVDRADERKQGIALEIIEHQAKTKSGVISTQVLQEFYSAATRKLGIAPFEARQHLTDFRVFDIVQVTPEIIEAGVDCSILDQISFWDGLIIASAVVAHCTELISEDLANGQSIHGVVVCNPFL